MIGYRTFLFNMAVAALGVAEAFDWTNALGSAKAGWALMAVGVVGTILRGLTKTPIFDGEPK